MNIKNLSMSFGIQEIFDDITLHINDNEKVGIIGMNGAGKSTFFNLILGKLEPDKGSIIFKPGTRIGFLPQVISDEIPSMDISVFDYLLEGRPIKKLENELADAYTEAATETDEKKIKILMKRIGKLQEKLEYFEVYNAENILLKIVTGMNIDSELLDMKLCNLSGGQKSKIAFARLLYSKPEVLLLDEPTSNLDIKHQIDVTKTLSLLPKAKGMLVIMISHDINITAKYADRIIMLAGGGIFADGTPKEVLTKENIRTVYGVDADVIDVNGRPHIILNDCLDDAYIPTDLGPVD